MDSKWQLLSGCSNDPNVAKGLSRSLARPFSAAIHIRCSRRHVRPLFSISTRARKKFRGGRRNSKLQVAAATCAQAFLRRMQRVMGKISSAGRAYLSSKRFNLNRVLFTYKITVRMHNICRLAEFLSRLYEAKRSFMPSNAVKPGSGFCKKLCELLAL